MENRGLSRINKKIYDEDGNKYSMFSGFWKDYAPRKKVLKDGNS